MSLQHTSEIKRIEVLPTLGEFTNVIKRVVLEVTFTDPDLAHPVESKTMMVSVLSSEDMSDFVQISDVTESQIIKWTFDYHGGEEKFVEMTSKQHGEELARRVETYGLKKFDLASQSVVDVADEYDDFLN